MDKRGGITIFRLSVPKYFIGEHFGVSEKFFYGKFSCIGGGGPSRFCQNFFVSQDRNEKLCKRTLLFSGNFLVSKKFMDQRGGVSIFSVEKFLSRSAENIRRGTLRCITKIRVAKNFMHQKGRGYQVSSSETFCHTVPKNIQGTSESFVHRKFLCKRWGYH